MMWYRKIAPWDQVTVDVCMLAEKIVSLNVS